MPLFRACAGSKLQPEQRRIRKTKWTGRWKTDEDDSVLSLTRLCLFSLADNMKEVWAKDYADNYLDHYSFRHIMGPFNLLPGELVEELLWLLCTRQELSRAALHLLLVPQLRGLSLKLCPGLVTPALCGQIVARCQGLWSLDLSGAQQLPPKYLSETLSCLPYLRSLSLAGMPCDGSTLRTIARCCRLLHHLDVSRCHLVSPAALLALGGGNFCSLSDSPPSSSHCTYQSKSSVSSSCTDPSSSSFITPLSPPRLSSLLALDIGFGEQEDDTVAAAAYLLLLLPCLERIALEGLAQACCLLKHRDFSRTNEFADREEVPRLEEVWRERRHGLGMDSWTKKSEEAMAGKEDDDDDDEEEEERRLWEEHHIDTEEDANRENQAEGVKKTGDLSQLILHLKDVKGLTCESLDSLGMLCPGIISMSVNIDSHEDTGESQGSLLAAGLQTWSGQLRSLSVHFLGHLFSLLPALHVAGSSLVSLTLEGVKTYPNTPLMELIKACPKLRDLVISAEPPSSQVMWGISRDDGECPRLPHLCMLRLNFSYEHSQMKPVMTWMALKKVLKCLLAGSPLLEKISLVALPCPLNSMLQDVLHIVDLNRSDLGIFPPMPLGRLRHIDLQRTDVKMMTVKSIMQRSKRLRFIDVRYCWQICQLEWLDCKRFSKIQVVWE